MFFLPESPRYLVETQRNEQAMTVLRNLHFNGTNADWVNAEYNEIKATIEAEQATTAASWTVMFKVPQWRTRLLYVSVV